MSFEQLPRELVRHIILQLELACDFNSVRLVCKLFASQTPSAKYQLEILNVARWYPSDRIHRYLKQAANEFKFKDEWYTKSTNAIFACIFSKDFDNGKHTKLIYYSSLPQKHGQAFSIVAYDGQEMQRQDFYFSNQEVPCWRSIFAVCTKQMYDNGVWLDGTAWKASK